MTDIQCMAVFCDFENIALGVRENDYARFEIKKILERLLLKGSIVIKKAYCDWDRYKEFKRDMHEAAFELIEIPHVRQSGKNSADIRMVVDALDLCYTKPHIDAFVLISGDSDFSPLVSKLRENNKAVVGVGVRSSTSDLLIANCDEFIFYDEFERGGEPRKRAASKKPAASTKVARPAAKRGRKTAAARVPDDAAAPLAELRPEARHEFHPEDQPEFQTEARWEKVPEAESDSAGQRDSRNAIEQPGHSVEYNDRPGDEPAHEFSETNLSDKKRRACEIVVSTLEQLLSARGEDELVPASAVKNAIKRIDPGFSEPEYGYKAFGKIVEDAQKRKMLTLERRERGGMYIGLPQGDSPRG